MRFLLAGAHGHGGDDHDDHGLLDIGHAEGADTQALRIAAIFIILVGSLSGALPPLFTARLQSPTTYVGSALRAFAGGVLIALALVHIVTHSVLEMSEVAEYPYSGLLMLAGVFIMVFTEHALQMLYHSNEAAKDPAPKDVDSEHGEAVCCHNMEHNHAHAGGITKVTAWMMEVGCVFHSVIIGVDLGVTTDAAALTPLLVALVFHQLIEGVSLGAVVASAGFSRVKALVMVIVYSVTTPIGVAIGIGVAESYDPESRKAIITKGCLDAISGGLLIYVALVHLLCPEFCSGRRVPLYQRLVSYLSVAAGAGIMAMLAIWA